MQAVVVELGSVTMSSPSDAVLDGAVVATPQPASASELTPEVAMSTPLAGPGATADVAPTTTDATPPSPVLDVLDGQDGTEAPPASVSAENSSAATPAPSSAAPAPVQGADEGAADATDVSIDVDAEGEGKQGGIAEAKSGDVHSDTPERTAKQKFQKAVRTVLGEESDDEDDKPKGPPSKWRFVRIFVDVVVLSWCFLLPIIASTQRELVRRIQGSWHGRAVSDLSGVYSGSRIWYDGLRVPNPSDCNFLHSARHQRHYNGVPEQHMHQSMHYQGPRNVLALGPRVEGADRSHPHRGCVRGKRGC